MNRIIPVVNNLIFLDDNGDQQPVPVSYREKSAEEVPTMDNLPNIVVQPIDEGYAILVLAATFEQQSQITEQIIGQFNYNEGKNESGNLKLDAVVSGVHGVSFAMQFEIKRIAKV